MSLRDNAILTNTESIELSDKDIDAGITSLDPGRRPTKLTINQQKFLIQCDPHQPKLVKYSKNSQCPDGKQNRFNSAWFISYPHLEYSIETDAAYCFVCCLFPSGPDRQKADDVWIRCGVRQ